MPKDIESTIREQEAESLRLELAKISEREAELAEKTKLLNQAIREHNEALGVSEKENLKKAKMSRSKKRAIVTSYILAVLLGAYLGVGGFISGSFADVDLKPGKNVQVNGTCKTRSNELVTLGGDQLRVISVSKDTVKGIIIGEKLIGVSCAKSDTRFESFSIISLFFKTTIKDTPTSTLRELETDQIYQLNKKSILASGSCTRDDGKKVIYSGRVLEVLDVADAGTDFQITAVESSTRKQVKCNYRSIKPTILTEELAKSMVQKELSEGLPPEATTLIGKDVLITGTCVLENYDVKKGKKPLMEFYKQLATVTSESRENNSVTKITATANDVPTDEEKTKLETVTVICDKKTFSNVFIEEYKKPTP